MPDEPESPWKEVLPLVVDAAAKSAEASTMAADAVSSFESRLMSLETAVNGCGDKLAGLVALEEERKVRETERGAWARSILTPQFLIYIIALLLGLAGFRVTMGSPGDIQIVTEQETPR